MTISPLTCLGCKRPFPPNGELASIPDTSKVAFDSAHRRVWRICDNCGEWNLLGTEASAAALPELEARFAAAPKAPGDAGFAPAHVAKSLELLRIGGIADEDRDDLAALRRRKEINRRVALVTSVFAIGSIGLLVNYAFLYRYHLLAHHLIGLVTYAPLMLLAIGRIRIRYRLPVKRWVMRLSVTGILAGLVLQGITDPPIYLLANIPVFALVGFLATKLPPISLLAVHLPRGYTVRFYTGKQLSDVTMSWPSAGDTISLHDLPEGRTALGRDAERLLRNLVQSGLGMRILLGTRAATEQAHDLLRSAGGLRGLLRALDGFRRDSDDRVVIAKLPKVYLIALDLALAPPVRGGRPNQRLRQKASEAAAIAREAEALDEQVPR